MKTILLLSACLILTACDDKTTAPPESASEPVQKSEAVTESSGARRPESAPSTDKASAKEAMSNQKQDIPEACLVQNAPRMPNGAPCSDSFYAEYQADICAAWRQKCCGFKGVCS